MAPATDPTDRKPPMGIFTRRSFLAVAAATGAAVGADLAFGAAPVTAAEVGPLLGSARATASQKVRTDAAAFQASIPIPAHPDNGDEAAYPDRSASYTKILQHNADGTVVTSEYSKLTTALASGRPSDFELLSLPGPRGLVDPLAAYAYTLEGSDPHAFGIPAAPTVTSARIQAEMAELYWMALARDIPFDNYSTDGTGIVNAAISDLNGYSDLAAPKVAGAVTIQSLFRDILPDNLTGNTISQYLLQDVPYGPQVIRQINRRRPAGSDFLTNYTDWLAVQRGTTPASPPTENPDHYLRNGRDLAEWVHSDFPAQAVLNAARIIVAQGNTIGDGKFSPGINDPNNPYRAGGLTKQIGFVTFGNQMFMDLTTRAAQLALQAAWYQKWLVHRRLRPEEYGGRIDNLRRGVTGSYAVGSQLNASLSDPARLGRVFAKWGSYLLPSAFPEGSPAHPAYPSGHSTYVAAGVTMIKAFVDGTLPVANPMRVTDPNNGDNLTPISSSLTINGELDKLVMNVGIGRLFAGVHWRSDHTYGVRLGELVAIRALQDLLRTYTDATAPTFDLRRFDGTTVTITRDQVFNGGTAVPLSNTIAPV